tara:strand:+ start:1125 stop:1748 length:624 start_codon:yes stop_codon:yes gene_type:complete
MCDNPNLNLNFFESRNTLVIETLLDITDEIASKITIDKYMWVDGNVKRSHGGFVRRLDNKKNVDNYKAYILPNVTNVSFAKISSENVNYESNMLVEGSNDTLTFTFENKRVQYKLCISEFQTEVDDNDNHIEQEEQLNSSNNELSNDLDNELNNDGFNDESNEGISKEINEPQMPEPKKNVTVGGRNTRKRSKKLIKKMVAQAVVDI